MRLLGAILTSLMAVSLAAAQTPKKDAAKDEAKPAAQTEPKKVKTERIPVEGAKPADAKATKSAEPKATKSKQPEKAEKPEKVSKEIADSYNAIALAERVAIQSDLIWTGDYNGMLTGEFGERAVAAVKAFQKRKGAKETGVLNLQERAALAAAAKPKQETVGWRIVDDLSTGARVGIPAKLMPSTNVSGGISRWSSQRGETSAETFRVAGATALAPIFERMKKEPAGRQTEYSVLKDDFFVISGQQNLKRFYVRAQLRGNEVRGLTILYDQAMQGIMEPVVVAMSSAYAAFPSGRANAPPPRRTVEYASGVAIAPGIIATSREALDGCYVVTIAGIGGADRIAEDKDKGIVLLRVFGADLKPVALADASKTADVTLLGVLDPQAQGGGAAVSAAKARVSDALALDPAPALGFDGAAALDAQGRLAGLVALKVPVVAGAAPSVNASAALTPVDAIRALLAAQNITPAAAAAGAEAAKSSVVRVICVRK
jgi:peptidoglycan hydrolase-like protein with peptidoglycan-binding domain